MHPVPKMASKIVDRQFRYIFTRRGAVDQALPQPPGNQTLIKYVKANLNCCLADSDWKLLLVKTCILVGTLPRGQHVYRIAKVLVVTLGPCSMKDLDVEVRLGL